MGTLTGILTDPQFRVVIRALEQRTGVDLITAPKVTTMSSRQAQIKAVDVRYIVTDLDLSQTASGGGVTAVGQQGGGGVVGSARFCPSPSRSNSGRCWTLFLMSRPTVTPFK